MIAGAALLVAAALVSGSPALAGGKLQIRPIRLELEAAAAGSFMLVNHADANVVLEARAFAWRQDKNGKDRLTPAADVILTPPIMRIAPGGAQTLRLGLKPSARPGAGEERAFRVLLEEVPPADAGRNGAYLQMRYVLPVFARQGTARAGPVELRAGAGEDCRIEAINRGARHIRIENIIVGMGAEDSEVDAPLYLLGQAHVELPCPEQLSPHPVPHPVIDAIRLESDAGVFTDTGGADDTPRP